MLRIDRDPVFTTTVRVSLPGAGEETFKATFRVLDIDKIVKFDLATSDGAREFLEAAIVSLDDIESAGGQRLMYSVELRDRILQKPHLRGALAAAYMRACDDAARGNVAGPAGHG